MQFLNPTNDFAFKQIFGNEKKKYILISFLNSVLRLPEHQQITAVSLLPSHQAPRMLGSKETILDVHCHDQSGTEYIVEMQVLPKEFFDKRVLYYAAKAYSQQLNIGEGYKLLKPVIFLGILNFKFTEDPHYISTHGIHNIETKEHLLQDFRFTFAELPKFHKTLTELTTIEDKWLYFLKHAQEMTVIPEVIYEIAIREAFEIINTEYWNKDSLHLYDMRGIYREDEINQVTYGYKKGHREAQHEIARLLLAKQIPLSIIAECTGLSTEAVEQA